MTALAADKARQRLDLPIIVVEPPVAAAAQIWQGSLVGVLAATGLAQAFTTSTTLKAVGVAIRATLGTTAGAVKVGCEAGDFEFENSTAGDLLANVDIGNAVYGVDDNTVAKTNGGATRSIAGILVGFGPITLKPIVRVGLGLGST